MLHITIIFFTVLLLPDLYLYGVHIRKIKRKWLQGLLLLPTLSLIVAYCCLTAEPNAMSHNAHAIGRLATLTLLVVFPKLLFVLCLLVGKLLRLPYKIYKSLRSVIVGTHPGASYAPTNSEGGSKIELRTHQSASLQGNHSLRIECILGLILAAVAFCIVLYGSTAGPTRFEVKEVEYSSPDLPQGFDGYRIVQISDIHIGSWEGKPEVIQRLVDRVNAQKANLIVFTGDLVNQRACELDGFQPILSQLHAADGVYSILGNHDYGTYYRWPTPEAEQANLQQLIAAEEQMGWKMLNNAHDFIHHNGDSILLVGVENDGEPPFSQKADLKRSLSPLPPTPSSASPLSGERLFTLLLSHNPTHWRREVLPDTDIQLMLAGHTHAMQIALFGHSLAELRYPEWSGLYREGSRALYVNVGIGYVGLPFRFGAWPEITVLTLKTQDNK